MSVPSSQTVAREANPRLQSSFFRLPPELLRLIFMDALVECDDPWRPYSGDEVHYYGFKYAGKITISLLLTCRHLRRGSPSGRRGQRPHLLAGMPNEQLRRVRHARFLVDVNWLKRPNSLVSWPEELALRKLTITVRRTWLRQDGDWSDLDEVGPLSPTDPDQTKWWGEWISNISTLQELVIELESHQGANLKDRILPARRWKFHLAKGGCLGYVGELSECIIGDPPSEDEDFDRILNIEQSQASWAANQPTQPDGPKNFLDFPIHVRKLRYLIFDTFESTVLANDDSVHFHGLTSRVSEEILFLCKSDKYVGIYAVPNVTLFLLGIFFLEGGTVSSIPKELSTSFVDRAQKPSSAQPADSTATDVRLMMRRDFSTMLIANVGLPGENPG
ncbi:hypothetical protein K438DRAFT_1783694 [Mycena galopus ATCC 62051]|nr:hypothetical protein K438DRAFT_1783694 [Mycena galopus ATCC 62051]